MIPVIRKIGSYFRRQIGAETGLAGRHRCGLCNEPTDPSSRPWSPHRERFVDNECIPAIVRAAGPGAVLHWLETDELPG